MEPAQQPAPLAYAKQLRDIVDVLKNNNKPIDEQLTKRIQSVLFNLKDIPLISYSEVRGALAILRNQLEITQNSTDLQKQIDELVASNFNYKTLPSKIKAEIPLKGKDLKSMRVIDKQLKGMTEEQMIEWVNTNKRPLRDLGLSDNNLKLLLEKQGEKLKYFEYLHIRTNIYELLQKCPNVTEIKTIALTNDEGGILASIIRKLPLLTSFHLSNIAYLSEGRAKAILSAVGTLNYLKEFGFNGAPMSSEKIISLLPNPSQLVVLDLARNNVEHAVDFALKLLTFKALEKLDLSFSSIDNYQIATIAQVLPRLQVLRFLDLRFNRISQWGLEALVPALQRLSVLEELRFSHTAPNENIDTLVNSLPALGNLKTLDLSNNTFSAERLASALTRMPQISELYLNRCKLTNDSIKTLAPALPNRLITLDLGNNAIPETGMWDIIKALDSMTQIKTLILEHNMITQNNVADLAAVLSKLINLQNLNLSSCKINDDMIVILAASLPPNLTRLDLGWNDFKDRGVQAITVAIPGQKNLIRLDIFLLKWGHKSKQALKDACKKQGCILVT